MTAALLHDHEKIPVRSSDDFLQKAASSTGLQNELSENKPNKSSRFMKTVAVGAVASAALVTTGVGAVNIVNSSTPEQSSTQENPADPLADIMYPESSVVGSPQEVVQDGPAAYAMSLEIMKAAGVDPAKVDNLGPTLTSSENLGVINPGDSIVVVKTDVDNDGHPDYIATTSKHIVHDISDDEGLPTVQTH